MVVAIGVGLCATFGAQLTPKTLKVVTIELSEAKSQNSNEKSVMIEEPMARVMAWWSNAGVPFSGGLLLIFLGSFIARGAKRAALTDANEGLSAQGSQSLNTALEAVISHLETTLNDELSLDEIKVSIEEVQRDHLNPLIETREITRANMGTPAFIEAFGPIALGERKLNRAWAACVDKHQEEAVASIGHALESFRLSLSLVA